MRFYTWKDIERYILMHHDEWKDELYDIEVYPNEMVVYPKSEQGTLQNAVLKKLFPKNIAPDNLSIKLDGQGEDLMILYEYEYSPVTVRTLPLFKKAIYEDSIYPTEQLADLSCPVFAFHSYKGGVGRTLSLIAFARAWTNLQKNPENSKLLIIDSDLEAPGLTLIQGDLNDSAFSYLDLLTLIQDNSNVEEIVSTAGNLMGTITLPIETSQQRVEHFFLPTYRYEEQLFDLYASPQTITASRNKEYILAEVLSKLASSLGATAVLVDLRAGISEYSAPLLLDPRVKKYCVTSTSLQSVMGTKQVLSFIAKGLKITEDTLLPTVFLGMIPETFSRREKQEIKENLLGCFETTEVKEELLDNMIVELPFASELIHLTEWKQILNVLKDRDMYDAVKELVKPYCISEEPEREIYTEKQHQIITKQYMPGFLISDINTASHRV